MDLLKSEKRMEITLRPLKSKINLECYWVYTSCDEVEYIAAHTSPISSSSSFYFSIIVLKVRFIEYSQGRLPAPLLLSKGMDLVRTESAFSIGLGIAHPKTNI